MRYFLYLSYKGTNYHGWQVQKNALGVQEVLNKSLSTILRQPIETVGSGRTDTGVHALEQVVHFDAEINDELDFVYKLNSLLPKDIAAKRLRKVDPEANSRFDARERKYIYNITTVKDPFLEDRAYYFRKELDLKAMNEVRPILVEWEDYQCFSRVNTDVNHFLCHILDVKWTRKNELLFFDVTANRFLRGMVRALVGTMIELGLGRISKKQFWDILESKDRKKAGMSVPAHGLYLKSVKYPEAIFI